MPRRTQAERSAATTAELLAHASTAFGNDGYDCVSVEAVADAAGVTKGAVYHHFGGKRELFQAVYADAHHRIAARTTGAVAGEMTGWARLEAGTTAFLTAVARPRLQRIVVVDGPRVLAPAVIREIEDRYAAGLLRQAFFRLREAGVLIPGDDVLRTRMVIGAICEAATAVAESSSPAEALGAAHGEIRHLLRGLRA
ncbi:TetR/AcrR family transcriptional regulator [Actinoplanes sp. NPDC051513]|uniref:TetR/AcrR family transcriptional regulator n=1 Tax=Actinoplanes sp. NPDC051513 TaxID=3363908 RepID=UPI00378F997B